MILTTEGTDVMCLWLACRKTQKGQNLWHFWKGGCLSTSRWLRRTAGWSLTGLIYPWHRNPAQTSVQDHWYWGSTTFRINSEQWRQHSRKSDQDDSSPREPTVSFFNDYSADVVWKRKAFDDTKTRLKKMNILLHSTLLLSGWWWMESREDLIRQRTPNCWYSH